MGHSLRAIAQRAMDNGPGICIFVNDGFGISRLVNRPDRLLLIMVLGISCLVNRLLIG